MNEFETSIDGEGLLPIIWQVNVTWQLKDQLFKARVVDDNPLMGYQIDKVAVDGIIFPEYIASWDREEELTEEAYKSLPMAHRDQLAFQVALYAMTGYDMTADMRQKKAEGEAAPLAGKTTKTA